jgi:hypothetical protein
MCALSAAGVRVLHAPLDIGGQVSTLCRAERDMGLDSHILLSRPDPRSPEVVGSVLPAGFVDGAFPTRLGWLQRRRLVDWIIDEFDVVHFNFGRSILDYPYLPGFELRDLERLKTAGKRIVFTYQGCDARDKWDHLGPVGQSACPSCEVPWCGVKSLVRRGRLRTVRSIADRIFVLNPDLARRLPEAEFLPYAIGEPKPIRSEVPVQADSSETLTLVHAPTDRAIKGTRYVIEAVERLNGAGYRIRLDLVEGVTRREVYARIAAADIVVDQLLIGWYGGFAVESLWLGVPTVARINHAAAESLVDYDLLAELPVIHAKPDTLAEVLATLADDPNRRAEIGKRGRSFAKRWHDPGRVANRVIQAYLT